MRLIAVILALVLLAVPGIADERNLGIKCGDFWYAMNDDGTATLTACFNVAESLELPAVLDGIPLTAIGSNSFLYYSPVHVTIPEGVVELKASVFRDNEMIVSVTFPDSLTIVEGSPFVNCPNLAEIIISEEHPVLEITDGLLVHMDDMRLICLVNGSVDIVVVPENVTAVGDRAFYGNTYVKQVVLTENITAIGDFAFAGCVSMERLDIPASVTQIGVYALDGPGIVGVYRDSYAEEYCIANGVPYEYID